MLIAPDAAGPIAPAANIAIANPFRNWAANLLASRFMILPPTPHTLRPGD